MGGLSSIKSFFTPIQETESQTNDSSIDIVLYAISLSSSPQLITSYQEKLREITAKIRPGENSLSAETQRSLVDLYVEVENYLIEKEPLKKITKTELRKNIGKKFNVNSEDIALFWGRLPQ